MSKIFPIREVYRNSARILREVNSSDEPVTITRYGQATAVLMSPEYFETIKKRLDLLEQFKSDLVSEH
jgi:prevent-host-death family protein